jgi:glycerophosphoryl diester phosphodiesterase
MDNNLPRPTIYAHRGASAYAPENTIAAFALAFQQKAPAIELDAMLSADQEVVVIHDNSVDRTTNGTGKVSELPLKELKELDAGSFYDAAFENEKIPTLLEVLETFRDKLYINIELKNYNSPRDNLPAHVAKAVKLSGMENQVLFSSFNPLAILKIRKLLPDTPVAILAFPGMGKLWTNRFLGRIFPHQAVHPETQDISAKLIMQCQGSNKAVNTYTVNDPKLMMKFFEWGIDGIITDDPLLALQTLTTYQNQSAASK